jgi:predicted phosphoribosyltransferase
MRFMDREEAAALLVDRLSAYAAERPLVLGVPRGAVPMARIIADGLGGDLDVVLVRKLRAPGQPELAIGAVDESGTVSKGSYFDVASDECLRRKSTTSRKSSARDAAVPCAEGDRSAGRIVIIVDDGIATGSSMLAAIRSVRARKPRKIVVAIGVAPPQTLAQMKAEADEVVCLQAPADFAAVGQYFEDFSEVTDDMVVTALSRAARAA